jgi:hypothetical protein
VSQQQLPTLHADAAGAAHQQRSGRLGEQAGGAAGLALAFVAKAALLVAGAAALQLPLPKLAVEAIYSELASAVMHGRCRREAGRPQRM